MAKRQTHALTPAEAVRQGRKLIAERQRQEAARKAAMQPEATAQPEPISEPICQPDPPLAASEGGRSDLTEIRQRLDGARILADAAIGDAQRLRGEVEAAGQGGAEAEAGKPVPVQDQGVEVVSNYRKIPGSSPVAEPSSTLLPEPTKSGAKYSDFIPPASAMSVFTTSSEVPKTDTHPDGTWPLTDLRSGQCRFACTADDAPRDQHRFCGRPTRISRSNLHGSWCDEHLPRVWGEGSVSERIAHLVTKDVRRFG